MFNGFHSNTELSAWVDEMETTLTPSRVVIVDGSSEEWDVLTSLMLSSGSAVRLNPELRPDSFLVRSDPRDVARVENRTFICTEDPADAGPTNNWRNPDDMLVEQLTLLNGAMAGRTMYVVAYSMGPVGGPLSQNGVMVTDSEYVVASMSIMTRIGQPVLDEISNGAPYITAIHSVGYPLSAGAGLVSRPDVAWPCDPDNVSVAHYPERYVKIISYGSGYGGNALLGKKCHALRIASFMARDEGWMAEHMAIVKMIPPREKGRRAQEENEWANGYQPEPIYVTAAFPSACGKTNFAMLDAPEGMEGWKFETLGDDIAWMKPGKDGKLYAINPEAGFFGVAPGTNYHTNRNAMESMRRHTIFTNVALTDDGDVWWEGMTETKPDHLIDWLGKSASLRDDGKYQYDHEPCGEPLLRVAHPNSRFTAPITNCPVLADEYHKPEGVPISAILFGGRRKSFVPLVTMARTWEQGVYFGATVSSEQTAAAEGKVGVVRYDPMAMRPFIGYNAGEYFQHWISMSDRLTQLPRIFLVNWFRKGADGAFLWPGFSKNAYVLAWIYDVVTGDPAVDYSQPFGDHPLWMSVPGVEPYAILELLEEDQPQLKVELKRNREYLQDLYEDDLPSEFWEVQENYEFICTWLHRPTTGSNPFEMRGGF